VGDGDVSDGNLDDEMPVSTLNVQAMSDEALVAQAQQRNEACMAALYERYYDRIYRYTLSRLGNQADAEDLTQETFLKMVDKLHTFRWQGIPFTAWLFRIANNSVVDMIRRRSRQPQQELNEAIPLESGKQVEEQVEFSLTLKEVITAMARLTSNQQEVLAMRFGAELSVKETAKALGKAEGTVKSTQLQALQALRRTVAHAGNSLS